MILEICKYCIATIYKAKIFCSYTKVITANKQKQIDKNRMKYDPSKISTIKYPLLKNRIKQLKTNFSR